MAFSPSPYLDPCWLCATHTPSNLDLCWLCTTWRHTLHIWDKSIYSLFIVSESMSVCSLTSVCDKWGRKKKKEKPFPLWSSVLIDSSLPTSALYLTHPFLIAICTLSWHRFIAGCLHPNTPSGIYLVHAKLKLIHIWADQHPQLLSPMISVSSLIRLSVCKEEGCGGCIIAHISVHGHTEQWRLKRDEGKVCFPLKWQSRLYDPELWYRPESEDNRQTTASVVASTFLPPTVPQILSNTISTFDISLNIFSAFLSIFFLVLETVWDLQRWRNSANLTQSGRCGKTEKRYISKQKERRLIVFDKESYGRWRDRCQVHCLHCSKWANSPLWLNVIGTRPTEELMPLVLEYSATITVKRDRRL